MAKRTVEIFLMRWEVCFIESDKMDAIAKENGYTDDDYLFGLTDFKNLIIYIRFDVNDSVVKKTMLHELTHAFVFSGGYTLSDEEEICDFFSVNGPLIIKLAEELFEEYKKEVVS